MNLKSLTYFIAALEEGNITAAAKRCHISQPSISNAISALEEDLNALLFTRHKKGVTPTSEGRRLYNLAKQILNDVAAVKATFAKKKAKQTIKLGLMTAIDMKRVLALFAPILENKEDYELHLTDENAACDARITCKNGLKDEEVFHALWQEPFVVALPEGHPLSLQDAIWAKDLVGLPLIAREYCSFNMFAHELMQNMDLNIVATAQSEEWAVGLVNVGLGAAILPEAYIQPNHQIVARPFADLDVTREVGLAHASSKPLPEAFKLLLNK